MPGINPQGLRGLRVVWIDVFWDLIWIYAIALPLWFVYATLDWSAKKKDTKYLTYVFVSMAIASFIIAFSVKMLINKPYVEPFYEAYNKATLSNDSYANLDRLKSAAN